MHVSGPLEQKKNRGEIFILNFAIHKENFHIPASMKTKQVCIWSAFWKLGWILLKPGVQVSIGHCIIDNENRVTGKSNKRPRGLTAPLFNHNYILIITLAGL